MPKPRSAVQQPGKGNTLNLSFGGEMELVKFSGSYFRKITLVPVEADFPRIKAASTAKKKTKTRFTDLLF